jgi:NADPH:quinone reductase-like Zn-dependent oxidoreductase
VKLAITKAGLSSDNWHYIEFAETEVLADDEVDIEFGQTALTLQDVETALGRSVKSTIGLDVRGTITRVGRDVTGFHPGDEVTTLVLGGSIQSSVRAKVPLVRPHKAGVFPSLFISAYYALVHLGRTRPGKSVLIHGGASAHGLAAIHVAKLLGADIFATVVGQDHDHHEAQRRILQGCGLTPDKVFNAQDEFVASQLSTVAARGVDIVYSTTTQDDTNRISKCVKSCKFETLPTAVPCRTTFSASNAMRLRWLHCSAVE